MVDHENILTRKFFALNFLTRKFSELQYYSMYLFSTLNLSSTGEIVNGGQFADFI